MAGNASSRESRKQYRRIVAEPDVLRALADIEADLRGALSRLAAVDLQDGVLQGQAGKSRPHRRAHADGDGGPAQSTLLCGESDGRRQTPPRSHTNIAAGD